MTDSGAGRGYDVYLGAMRLPVAPQKCELRIKNRNETLSLLADGEINLLKAPGLSEISFECLLPQVPYPFAHHGGAFRPADWYLGQIERLKLDRKPFQFIVSRAMPTGKALYATNMKVSLEEYTVLEEAENGFDVTVKIELRQYRDPVARTVSVRLPARPQRPVPMLLRAAAYVPAPAPAPVRPESTVQPVKPIVLGCEVILNGQVFRDSYGNGPGAVFSEYRGRINFINGGGSHPYHVATLSGGWLGWVQAGCVRAV